MVFEIFIVQPTAQGMLMSMQEIAEIYFQLDTNFVFSLLCKFLITFFEICSFLYTHFIKEICKDITPSQKKIIIKFRVNKNKHDRNATDVNR